MSRLLMLALAGATSLFAVGCANGDKPAQSSLATPDQGVTCEKCKTTWVKSPSGRTNVGVVRYTWQQSHECPDCKSAVENFFTTGTLAHDCKSCGPDALKVCEKY